MQVRYRAAPRPDVQTPPLSKVESAPTGAQDSMPNSGQQRDPHSSSLPLGSIGLESVNSPIPILKEAYGPAHQGRRLLRLHLTSCLPSSSLAAKGPGP